MKKKKYRQGFFHPVNDKKYVGRLNEIMYRSNLEYNFMKFFDRNKNILQWGSEEIVIPYKFDVDGKSHRYFPDFWIKYKDKKGNILKAIIEIKPSSQLKKPKKSSKNYRMRAIEYIKNRNKWDYAIEFCRKNDMKFFILTEKEMDFII